MRILVTGTSGYVGQHLLDALARTGGHTVTAAYGSLETFEDDFGGTCACRSCDLSDRLAVVELVRSCSPEVVVHLGAVSSPAACEKDPERARAINCPTALLDALPPTSALVFISTDQVYEGVSAPYVETSPTEPVNAYGRSKLEFERAVLAALPRRSVCLRSSLILGPPTRGRCRKQSFLQFCDERLRLDEPTDFFSDEFRSVVSVEDIVLILLWLIDGGVTAAPGVYNMGGPERLTRVGVAEAVARAKGLPADRIRPVERAKLPAAPGAPRSPPDLARDSSKLVAASGITLRPLSAMLSGL